MFPQDSEEQSDGFLVILDDTEFAKFTVIVVETIKTLARIKQENVYEVREQKFVTNSEQDEILVDVRNPAEAQTGLREISIIKKRQFKTDKKVI